MPPDTHSRRALLTATIERITDHGHDTRSIFLRLPAGEPFRFVPGQFVSLQLPIDGDTLIKPYSLASDPESELLEICLNLVPGGRGSAYLFGLEPGEELHLTGPWGTFTLAEPPPAECVFLADGTGIAPIRPMLHRVLARASTRPLRLHYRADSVEAVLYRSEIEVAQRAHPHLQFEPVISAQPSALLERTRTVYVDADSDRSRYFYICGVGQTVTQLRDLLRGAGYARRAVQYEKW